jgi:S-adenosylmethionine:tRNA ribosyltransferase-isomerase
MSELDQYDYELPPHLIAQSPAVNRTDARLLVVDRGRGSLEHRHIRDLPEFLRANDCLVVNDTRVVPARLVGRRTRTGGRWEGLFVELGEHGLWRVMGKTRGKLSPGETITLVNADGHGDTQLELAARQPDGSWIARPRSAEEPFSLLARVGRVPLPPYIRKGEMVESDREHYQTVYARTPGAVAAPTAGLHFTESLLRRLESQGVTIVRLTLHVGLGTFRPITADTLAEHKMHSEWGCLGQEAVDAIAACRQRGGRVVAVGTTSVRVLETAAAGEEMGTGSEPVDRSAGETAVGEVPVPISSRAVCGTLRPFTGRTDLFIRPPYQFRAVDAMLTNFHLPRTTLLVLVRAFGGDILIRQAYEEAICEEYRFYSYGDAMLIV